MLPKMFFNVVIFDIYKPTGMQRMLSIQELYISNQTAIQIFFITSRFKTKIENFKIALTGRSLQQ